MVAILGNSESRGILGSEQSGEAEGRVDQE